MSSTQLGDVNGNTSAGSWTSLRSLSSEGWDGCLTNIGVIAAPCVIPDRERGVPPPSLSNQPLTKVLPSRRAWEEGVMQSASAKRDSLPDCCTVAVSRDGEVALGEQPLVSHRR